MTKTRNKALLIACVLLAALFAGPARAEQAEAAIEAANPYMAEAISEALDGIEHTIY